MRIIFSIFLFVLIFCTCNKESNHLTISDYKVDSTGIVIKYGMACGWCGGNDSLTIFSNDLWYFSHSPCDNTTKVEHELLSENEKNDLLNSLNLNDFSKIEINTCFICVDGCDKWISVKNNNYYHQIRYGTYDSLTMRSIKNFVDKLDLLKAKFK
jgi:hypothetical protein